MSLDEASLLADVRSRLFAPSPDVRTIGAELELIPIFSETHLPVLIESESGTSLTSIVRRAAALHDWEETRADFSAPEWNLRDGGRISFEPGGQIEISSPPHSSCSALIASLQSVVANLADSARADGVELLTFGTDPYNDIDRVPLQLSADRYARMTRYFEARGEFGIRMMRQTAALQMSVEHGPRPLERWQLLNALAPYVIAIFANSPRYAGRDTGHASYRSHFWRELDETRAGIPFDSKDPAAKYASFALDAGALRAENGKGELHSFRSLMGNPSTGVEDWTFHLSTLFPEVRPKEYFEIRSPDVIAVDDLAAPLSFVAGLVYDDSASHEALALLGEPNAKLLRTAGRDGLRNAGIKELAFDLVSLSIEGAARLPEDYLTADDRARAAKWLTRRVA